MANSLLDRQRSLVEYLTSTAGILDERPQGQVAPSLDGIDRGLLQIEAHFSHSKRMEKISAVFPKTFELIGDRQAEIVCAFVAACPPASISRLDNARQFHRFLTTQCRHKLLERPHIGDVATCELACAAIDADDEDPATMADESEIETPQGAIRRCAAVILLRCGYDIRPIFEGRAGQTAPSKRELPLVVAQAPGTDHPQVFEVPPPVYDLLAALEHWTVPPPASAAPWMGRILAELAERGVIEVRQ
jgi:hypothetical protein